MEAVNAIAQNTPDLVVLDYEMPVQNGAEVCAVLRNSESSAVKNLPIIMLTAHSGEAEEVNCLRAGANDFVTKPVSASVLHARILTQLRLRSHARELEDWRRRYEADLACARSTQQCLIPQVPPAIEDWEIQTCFAPLIEVGGDIYGWERLHDGRWLLWMADSIGHGAAAALMTALTVHLFSKASEMAVSPSEVLAKVNHEFTRAIAAKTFMTACCVLLDRDGSAIFSSVGQPPLLVRRADGTVESFASDKAMLGVDPALKPGENAVSLSQGDVLLIHTDGLHSFRNPGGEKLTAQSVEACLREHPLGPEMLGDLCGRIASLSNGSPAFDDLAAIAIRRLD